MGVIGTVVSVSEIDSAVLDPEVRVPFGEGASDVNYAMTLRLLAEKDIARDLLPVAVVLSAGEAGICIVVGITFLCDSSIVFAARQVNE